MEIFRAPIAITVIDNTVEFKCPWCGILETAEIPEGKTEWSVVSKCCATTENEAASDEVGAAITKTSLSIS